MTSSLKDSAIVAAARTWIRYAPTTLLKQQMWRFAHWRDHHYTARTQHGFRMRGHSNDLVQGYAYYFGTWEPNLTAWLSSRFRRMENEIFLDVGANVGYYSLLAHHLMPSSNGVVAIEASPVIFDMLSENIQLNRFDRIRAVNCAASAERGKLRLYQGDAKNLGGTTTQAGVWSDAGIEVEALPLAEILRDHEIGGVRLVKIDVEGAEWSVLEGMRPVLARFQPDVELVVEIGGGNAGPIFELFSAAGFNAYALQNDYSYKCYLSPAPIEAPKRLRDLPTNHGDVVFSRADADTL